MDLSNPFPFREASFDGVLAIGVLMHLEKASVEIAFKEVERILIPSGTFFFSAIASRDDLDEHGRDAGGRWYNLLDSSEWISLLDATGFFLHEKIFESDGLGRSGITWNSFLVEKSS
jgi:SAM-dependent methyltransferase